MLEQERDNLRRSNKQIDSLYGKIDELLSSSTKIQIRRTDALETRFSNMRSIFGQTLRASEDLTNNDNKNLIGKLHSFVGNYIEIRRDNLKTLSESRVKTFGNKLKSLVKPKESLDNTDDFLRMDNSKSDIVKQLKLLDSNLTMTIGGSSNIPTTNISKKDDESDSSSTLAKAAGLLGILVAGKKMGGATAASKGIKYAGKALKAGGKFAKRMIPLVGVAFSLWDIATTLRDGYNDYTKFSKAGNKAAAKSAIGYTLIGTMGGLLGVVGSLASATGIGLAAGLAIDAVGIGLSMFAESLRNDNLAKAEAHAKNGPLPVVKPAQPKLNVDRSQNIKESQKIVNDANKSISKSLVVPKDTIEKKWYEGIVPDFILDAGGYIGDTFSNAADYITNKNVAKAGAGYLILKNDDGTFTKKTGSRNFRNNNPGNINYNAYTRKTFPGIIGRDDKGFAIFDTYENGKKAKYNLLFVNNNKQKYKQRDLFQAMEVYAPRDEKRLGGENKPTQYASYILKSVGSNKRLGDYSESERMTILSAMERMEGMKVGKVETIKAYATGTNKIEKSGLALVHKDEMIIPNKNASKIRSVMNSRQTTVQSYSDDELSEDFWINTFMVELANVVKAEYLEVANGI